MKLRRMVLYKAKTLGELPKDMLRYDTAFVSDKFPGVVAFCQFQSKFGINPGVPTTGRWQSFCVKLELLSADECLAISPSDMTKFYTYQHPVTGHVTDYGEYEKIPLERYMEAKDWREVQVKK